MLRLHAVQFFFLGTIFTTSFAIVNATIDKLRTGDYLMLVGQLLPVAGADNLRGRVMPEQPRDEGNASCVRFE